MRTNSSSSLANSLSRASKFSRVLTNDTPCDPAAKFHQKSAERASPKFTSAANGLDDRRQRDTPQLSRMSLVRSKAPCPGEAVVQSRLLLEPVVAERFILKSLNTARVLPNEGNIARGKLILKLNQRVCRVEGRVGPERGSTGVECGANALGGVGKGPAVDNCWVGVEERRSGGYTCRSKSKCYVCSRVLVTSVRVARWMSAGSRNSAPGSGLTSRLHGLYDSIDGGAWCSLV